MSFQFAEYEISSCGQMPTSDLFDGSSMNQRARDISIDDSEPYVAGNRLTSRVHGLSENNLLKSFAEDNSKANSVAKIKVVVCSGSL